MKAEIAKQWAAELRSGKWSQGRRALSFEGKHCCLGVLCEVAISSGLPVSVSANDGLKLFDYMDGTLPPSVREWSGMQSRTGLLPYGRSLASRNDNGETFSEIADIIEANADNL